MYQKYLLLKRNFSKNCLQFFLLFHIQTVADMNEIDKQRKEEFKEYEMKKKAEEDHKLAQMNEEVANYVFGKPTSLKERKKAMDEVEEAKKRHNEHEKLKHPGSRDQLEEVWSETDHVSIFSEFYFTFLDGKRSV